MGGGDTGRGGGAAGTAGTPSVPANTRGLEVRLGAFAVNNAMGDCLPRSLHQVFSSHLRSNGEPEGSCEDFMPWVVYRQVLKEVLAGLKEGAIRPTDGAFQKACLAGFTRQQTGTEELPSAEVVVAGAWDTTLLHLADAVAHQYKEHEQLRLVGRIIELLQNKQLYANDRKYVRAQLPIIMRDVRALASKNKKNTGMLVTTLEAEAVSEMVAARMTDMAAYDVPERETYENDSQDYGMDGMGSVIPGTQPPAISPTVADMLNKLLLRRADPLVYYAAVSTKEKWKATTVSLRRPPTAHQLHTPTHQPHPPTH
jgi:hypothetical protein